MSTHLPTGSSDEIVISRLGLSSTSPPGRDQPDPATAEEALRLALHARCGDMLPNWSDVIAAARSLGGV